MATMTSATLLRIACLTLACALAAPSPAEQPAAQPSDTQPTEADQLANHVREAMLRYRTLLPNLIANEHSDSQVFLKGKLARAVHLEAELTMGHPGPGSKRAQFFLETRHYLSADGHPISEAPDNIPLLVTDVFANLNPQLFEQDSKGCHRFLVEHPGDGSLWLDIAAAPDLATHADQCPGVLPQSLSRYRIDPASFEVLEVDRPIQLRNDLQTNQPKGQPEFWRFRSHVTVVRVVLGDATFLLPTRMEAEIVNEQLHLRRTAAVTYTDYHRFASDATILPANETGDQHR